VHAKNRNVPSYIAVIKGDPEGGYRAEGPWLLGCYSQGETVAERIEHIREAAAGVLEVMKEQGE